MLLGEDRILIYALKRQIVALQQRITELEKPQEDKPA